MVVVAGRGGSPGTSGGASAHRAVSASPHGHGLISIEVREAGRDSSLSEVSIGRLLDVGVVGTLLCLLVIPSMFSETVSGHNCRVRLFGWVNMVSAIVFLGMMMVMSLFVVRSDLVESDGNLLGHFFSILISLSPDLSKILLFIHLSMHLFLLTGNLSLILLLILHGLPSEFTSDSNFGIFVIFGICVHDVWHCWHGREALLVSFGLWLECILNIVEL